ncbi:MAG: hypothetical protein AB7G47_10290 [Mycolicibacterium sp.]
MPESAGADVDAQWGQAGLWKLRPRRSGALWLLGLFFAYLATLLLFPYVESDAAYVESDGFAVVWLPNAVLVTGLLRFRPRDWPYVYAVDCLPRWSAT